jgi:hypothetical protein
LDPNLPSFRSRLCIILLPLLLAAATHGQQPAALAAPPASYAFPNNLTLNYSVDWRLFPAGTATFHLSRVGDRININATASTTGAINTLYRVNDHFQSSFDAVTGCSYSLSKQAEEGRRRVNSDLRFDYASGRQLLTEHNLVTGTTQQKSGPITSCVTDILSGIFYFMSQPIAVDRALTAPLADSLRTVTVSLKGQARDPIHVPAGNFYAIRTQPVADAGIVKNRGELWIWYTDDDRRIPVQIKARLLWGTLTLHLTSIEEK